MQVPVTVQIMLDTLEGQKGKAPADTGSRYLALLALGEMGRTADLSGFDGVRRAVNGALEGSSSDELRAAASHALGGLAVGSTSAFLPFILQQVQAQVSQLACTCVPLLKTGLVGPSMASFDIVRGVAMLSSDSRGFANLAVGCNVASCHASFQEVYAQVRKP